MSQKQTKMLNIIFTGKKRFSLTEKNDGGDTFLVKASSRRPRVFTVIK